MIGWTKRPHLLVIWHINIRGQGMGLRKNTVVQLSRWKIETRLPSSLGVFCFFDYAATHVPIIYLIMMAAAAISCIFGCCLFCFGPKIDRYLFPYDDENKKIAEGPIERAVKSLAVCAKPLTEPASRAAQRVQERISPLTQPVQGMALSAYQSCRRRCCGCCGSEASPEDGSSEVEEGALEQSQDEIKEARASPEVEQVVLELLQAEIEEAGASPDEDQGALEPLPAEIEEARASPGVEQGALEPLQSEIEEAGASPEVDEGALKPLSLKRQGQVVVKGRSSSCRLRLRRPEQIQK